MTILDKIIEDKKEELAETKRITPLAELKARLVDIGQGKDFIGALNKSGLQIIAEVKPASPSKGVIRPDCNPVEIARVYEQNGAAAVSVLTERHYFNGSLENLMKIRQNITLPLLRKDFISEPYQIYEAKAAGADAVLLIAAILSKEQMQDFYGLARELDLAALTEVHNYKELDKTLLMEPPIVGINNRDLKTMKTDIETSVCMITDIPPEVLVVSESGIKTSQDMKRLAHAGVEAVLVGETLMQAEDIGGKLKELLSHSHN